MTEYTLSVVQLCPDAPASAADAIAEAAGYGPGNLSVRLQGAGGALWRGCHAWWIPAVLAEKSAPTGDPAIDDVLAQVVTSVREHSDPTGDEARQHWLEALAANGLTVVEPSE
ncbi:hypothetical protein SAMN05216229_1233 [Geopseudomonas sagittaria]|uniref:Uncharacterized protein n=1 Tax=Geopseudomonas sagittaria TaxID=1135990 RepID=A0A1I5YN15_9GAMM|nr:hypothetical protein [Pseudomonas sagittaria]SFQ45629.1 hypothetical protein SAMN05216229_1233 [Pseudomonas sagittaria]